MKGVYRMTGSTTLHDRQKEEREYATGVTSEELHAMSVCMYSVCVYLFSSMRLHQRDLQGEKMRNP